MDCLKKKKCKDFFKKSIENIINKNLLEFKNNKTQKIDFYLLHLHI
jgi:hypothetical protein